MGKDHPRICYPDKFIKKECLAIKLATDFFSEGWTLVNHSLTIQTDHLVAGPH